jgi:hypothetical protein
MTDASTTEPTIEPTGAAPAVAKKDRQMGRRIGTGVAAFLAVVLFLVATVGVWAKQTVLSSDRIVAAVDSAITDPTVVDALATRITQEIVSVVDVQTMLEGVLPSRLDPLAKVIEATVTDMLQKQVTNVITSPEGKALLDDAVRQAHDAAIRILNRGGLAPNSIISVDNGKVTLDVVPLIARTLGLMQQRGIIPASFDVGAIANAVTSNAVVQKIADVFGVTVPPDFGQIVLLDSQKLADAQTSLATAQRAMALFQKATVLLVVLALILLFVAMYVSADRRRTLVQISAGIGIGAIVMRIGIDTVVQAIDNAIRKAGIKAAAVHMTVSLTESLARTLVTLGIVGLTVAVIAFLLKPTKDGGESWLTGMVSAHADIARFAVIGLGLVLLAAVGITWVTIILVGALCVGGVLYVNRHAAAPVT